MIFIIPILISFGIFQSGTKRKDEITTQLHAHSLSPPIDEATVSAAPSVEPSPPLAPQSVAVTEEDNFIGTSNMIDLFCTNFNLIWSFSIRFKEKRRNYNSTACSFAIAADRRGNDIGYPRG